MLPNYFYFNGVLHKIQEDKISVIVEHEGCPPTSLGLLPTDELSNRVNYIQGRILTVIDATYSDKEQKKAVKDLIKQILSEEHSRLQDSATGFHTLSQGDMIQFSGDVDTFYKDNVKIEQ